MHPIQSFSNSKFLPAVPVKETKSALVVKTPKMKKIDAKTSIQNQQNIQILNNNTHGSSFGMSIKTTYNNVITQQPSSSGMAIRNTYNNYDYY